MIDDIRSWSLNNNNYNNNNNNNNKRQFVRRRNMSVDITRAPYRQWMFVCRCTQRCQDLWRTGGWFRWFRNQRMIRGSVIAWSQHTTTPLSSTNCSGSHRRASYSELPPPILVGSDLLTMLWLKLFSPGVGDSSVVRGQRQLKVIKWSNKAIDWLFFQQE